MLLCLNTGDLLMKYWKNNINSLLDVILYILMKTYKTGALYLDWCNVIAEKWFTDCNLYECLI